MIFSKTFRFDKNQVQSVKILIEALNNPTIQLNYTFNSSYKYERILLKHLHPRRCYLVFLGLIEERGLSIQYLCIYHLLCTPTEIKLKGPTKTAIKHYFHRIL